MVLTSDYPDNWTQIATAIKQAAGYRCDRCGLKCLPPARSYRHLDRSLRRRLSALLGETHAEETSARFHPQVHHVDRNPAHNEQLQSGQIKEYPLVLGERDPQNVRHWFWQLTYKEKQPSGKYKSRTVSVASEQVAAVRVLIAGNVDLELIISYLNSST
jgi:hypothetical protein